MRGYSFTLFKPCGPKACPASSYAGPSQAWYSPPPARACAWPCLSKAWPWPRPPGAWHWDQMADPTRDLLGTLSKTSTPSPPRLWSWRSLSTLGLLMSLLGLNAKLIICRKIQGKLVYLFCCGNFFWNLSKNSLHPNKKPGLAPR
jgi:hypothetical protein